MYFPLLHFDAAFFSSAFPFIAFSASAVTCICPCETYWTQVASDLVTCTCAVYVFHNYVRNVDKKAVKEEQCKKNTKKFAHTQIAVRDLMFLV